MDLCKHCRVLISHDLTDPGLLNQTSCVVDARRKQKAVRRITSRSWTVFGLWGYLDGGKIRPKPTDFTVDYPDIFWDLCSCHEFCLSSVGSGRFEELVCLKFVLVEHPNECPLQLSSKKGTIQVVPKTRFFRKVMVCLESIMDHVF